MMPELGGLELLGALRADLATRGLSVIVLSARADEEAATDGALVGTFAIYHGEPHIPGPEERSFIELFSHTAAVAIQRSRDARARAEQFSEPQTSLLPRALASVPGAEVAAVFRPATRDLQVGGDFYDVFPLGDGAWGFVIGDVGGRPPPAGSRPGPRHCQRRATGL